MTDRTDRKENRKHLYYLHELSDYKVDSDDPDVRGWPVKDADNRVVGKVDNLLVSKEKKRVLYLDVEVDKSIIDANHDPYGKSSSEVHEFINKDGENHLILPVGMARLNVDDKFVYTDRINHQTFAETKRMEKGYDVDRDYEVVVLESYNRDYDRDRNDNDRLRTDRDRNIGTGSTDSDITGSHTGSTGRETTLDEERRRMQEADRKRDRDSGYGDDRNIGGRSTGSDRPLSDSNTGGSHRDRDSLTGRESGTYSGSDKDSGRIADNDSFYDRGEFDYERFRNRDKNR